MHTRIHGSVPLKRENHVDNRIEVFFVILNMVEVDHCWRLIFFYQQINEIKLHIFFVLEVMDNQARMNAYPVGDFADRGAFEALLDEHLIIALEDVRFSSLWTFRYAMGWRFSIVDGYDGLVLPCKNHYLKVYILHWPCYFYGSNISDAFAAYHANGVLPTIINCIFN
jgi:hypothetical protein